jgi:hypothetical protein
MACNDPGQALDINCSGGKQVNQAAKTSCLNKLNTVTCTDFNAPTYDDDCEMVCTGSTTGAGGTGSGGTTGTGGTGGSSSATCGGVSPCGGAIAANWSITGVCVNGANMTNPDCPAQTITNVTATESGTLSFAAGGTYTANLSITLSFTDTAPVSCIGATATCADLQAGYVFIGASATCTGTTVCTCTVALASNVAEAGTYTTSGTSLNLTPAGGQADTMGYCVQGNTLRLLHFNGAGLLTTEEVAQRL